MADVPTKLCKGRCGLGKPLTDFVLDKRRTDGRGSYCRDCENERLRQRYHDKIDAEHERGRLAREANPERERAQARRTREANPEGARERSRRYADAHPDRRRESTERWRDRNRETVLELARRYRERFPLYHAWYNMIDRCENPDHLMYPRYGARGIKVRDRWHDFATFVADIDSEIGPRPENPPGWTSKKPYWTLDRIDNEHGNYEPGGVRWATPKQQLDNRGTQVDVSAYLVALMSGTLDEAAKLLGPG
jgi:hypothetical protein